MHKAEERAVLDAIDAGLTLGELTYRVPLSSAAVRGALGRLEAAGRVRVTIRDGRRHYAAAIGRGTEQAP